ncbi:GNAT family N-acetyltransferase [Paraburkholderia sp. RP-4-7]|uniref:GNAT family N-acetyltransferase n=1 Tax=Paraburkholderia polaris TaxID=2728848 RepID=A0A848IJR5_9BURK|nr:GNAT family N-acetyltransferase [Paraburkholderia polaris]NMM01066.1 GNAT family N-acetyltransferase [Paraburkholderia polaris]
MTHFEWRALQVDDTAALAQLFRAAVGQLAAADYDASARAAWVSAADDEQAFATRLARGLTLVALCEGQPAGFAQLYPADHVEMLYVAPGYARQGLAAGLLARLEAVARLGGATALSADVSLSARRSFESAGFQMLAAETVRRNGVSLARFRMRKPLDAAHTQP